MADTSDAGSAGASGGSVASVFEAIRHLDSEGGEYWSARELMVALTYVEWRNFASVVQSAMTACEASGHAASDHFVEANKMIPLGKGAQRKVDDWCCRATLVTL